MNNLIIFLFFIDLLILIIGLISPRLLKKIFKSNKFDRKFIVKVFGIALIVLFILIGMTAKSVEPVIKIDNNLLPIEPVSQVVNTTKPVSVTDVKQEVKNIENNPPLYLVTQVVDGDTIKVNIDGEITTLRLIGIDTPETVDPRKPVQCFGREASDKAKELLTNKKVRLEGDSTQGELDKYGRLLRYIFLEDGTFYNKLIIAEGYAHEYTYQSNPYKYQLDFQAAENEARINNKGLWSEDACNGDTTKSAYAQNVVTPVIQNINPIINSGPQVKKSSSGICHEINTTYYNRTTNFTPYNSIEDCLDSGGRLPKV